MVSFGQEIQKYRKRQKKSLRILASELQISPTYLSDIENGRSRAPATGDQSDFIERLAEQLHLSESEKQDLYYLADEELSRCNTISHELAHYLVNTPQARIALRKAANSNLKDETWEKIVGLIDRGDADDY